MQIGKPMPPGVGLERRSFRLFESSLLEVSSSEGVINVAVAFGFRDGIEKKGLGVQEPFLRGVHFGEVHRNVALSAQSHGALERSFSTVKLSKLPVAVAEGIQS